MKELPTLREMSAMTLRELQKMREHKLRKMREPHLTRMRKLFLEQIRLATSLHHREDEDSDLLTSLISTRRNLHSEAQGEHGPLNSKKRRLIP